VCELQQFTILVVDDSEDDIVLMCEAMADTPLQPVVREASSADKAIEYLRGGNRADLMIVDINMPGRNGFDLLHELKSDEELKFIPVMMLTTSALDSDSKAAFENGACAFVTKPLDFNELQRIANRISAYWSLVEPSYPR